MRMTAVLPSGLRNATEHSKTSTESVIPKFDKFYTLSVVLYTGPRPVCRHAWQVPRLVLMTEDSAICCMSCL